MHDSIDVIGSMLRTKYMNLQINKKNKNNLIIYPISPLTENYFKFANHLLNLLKNK